RNLTEQKTLFKYSKLKQYYLILKLNTHFILNVYFTKLLHFKTKT
ncbi:MAG: hypothetical protein ACI9JY_002255, partial [Saprospiraceae bacterium]